MFARGIAITVPVEEWREVLNVWIASDIFWFQSGMLGNPRKHSRTNFLVVMECKDKISPSLRGTTYDGSPIDV